MPAAGTTRAVAVAFSGTDGLSGVDSCATVTYSGPDNAAASVPGTCTDKAGNVSAPPRPRTQIRRHRADRHRRRLRIAPPTRTAGTTAPSRSASPARTRVRSRQLRDRDLRRAGQRDAPRSAGPAPTRPATRAPRSPTASSTTRPPRVTAAGRRNEPGTPTAGTTEPSRSRSRHRRDLRRRDVSAGHLHGPDSATASVVGRCTDRAGNAATAASHSSTTPPPPTATGSRRRASPMRAAGTTPGRGAFSGTDAPRGRRCATVTYSAPDNAAASVPGTCTDEAGNVSAARGTRSNTTPPLRPSPAAIRRAQRTERLVQPRRRIHVRGTDAPSGVAECASTTYGGPDSATASVLGACTDKAGNISAALPIPLKYDATAPAVDGRRCAGRPDANGWYNRAVSVAFSGTDETSGIDNCTTDHLLRAGHAARHRSPGRARDKAGNVSAASSFGLKFDGTGPVVTGAKAEPRPDHAGWFVSPVEYNVTGTDALSAHRRMSPGDLQRPRRRGRDGRRVVRDEAGNSHDPKLPNQLRRHRAAADERHRGGRRQERLPQLADQRGRRVRRRSCETPGFDAGPRSPTTPARKDSFVDNGWTTARATSTSSTVRDAAATPRTYTVVGLPAAPQANRPVRAARPGARSSSRARRRRSCLRREPCCVRAPRRSCSGREWSVPATTTCSCSAAAARSSAHGRSARSTG